MVMSLLNMKRKILDLYDTFVRDNFDTQRIDEIRDSLYNLEAKCIEGIEQLDILRIMFERNIKDRRVGGKWNYSQLIDYKANIESAFEIVMQTDYILA